MVNETPPEPPKPDLDVIDLTLEPEDLNAGEELIVTASVKNGGEANATDILVVFYVGELQIEEETIDSLGIGETAEVEVDWIVIEDAMGRSKLRVSLDPDDEIEEESETNNEAEETLDVSEVLIEDISDEFKHQSTNDFTEFWFSETFRIPPASGTGYKYFQLTRDSPGVYYLDVGISGFRTTKLNLVSNIEIQDASTGGWNGGRCIKKSVSADTCTWNGPQIVIALSFEGKSLVAKDGVGTTSKTTCLDNSIDEIKLVGLKRADWPEDELKTWRVTNAPRPNYMVPSEFYEIIGRKIYIHPMKWNPKSFEAEVALALRFRIITD